MAGLFDDIVSAPATGGTQRPGALPSTSLFGDIVDGPDPGAQQSSFDNTNESLAQTPGKRLFGAANQGSEQDVAGISTPNSAADIARTRTEYVDKPAQSIKAGLGQAASTIAFPVASIADAIQGGDVNKEALANSIDDFTHQKRAAAPDASVGFAGKMIRSLEELAPLVATGPAAVPLIAGEATASKGIDLADQGVTGPTNSFLSALSGAVAYGFTKLPFTGSSMTSSIARGATMNPVLGGLQRLAEKQVLEANDYDTIADSIKVVDPEAAPQEIAMGMLFGYLGGKGKPAYGATAAENFVPFWDTVKESNWYREKTIPERGLVVQDIKTVYDSLLAKGHNEADIAKMGTTFFQEALKRRSGAEAPTTEPVAAEPLAPPAAEDVIIPHTGINDPSMSVDDAISAANAEVQNATDSLPSPAEPLEYMTRVTDGQRTGFVTKTMGDKSAVLWEDTGTQSAVPTAGLRHAPAETEMAPTAPLDAAAQPIDQVIAKETSDPASIGDDIAQGQQEAAELQKEASADVLAPDANQIDPNGAGPSPVTKVDTPAVQALLPEQPGVSSIQPLADASDKALDAAYGYGLSAPGTFGAAANLSSASHALTLIQKGDTNIESLAAAIHDGWAVTARTFPGQPVAKKAKRLELAAKSYGLLPEEEKEKDRVAARAILEAHSQVQDSAALNPGPDIPPAAEPPTARAESAAKVTAASRKVDPSKDDIAVAISKLGGIDFKEAQSEWGDVVKDSRKDLANHVLKQTRRFGAVFKNGGLPLDKMRESLVGHGYLPEGADLHDLYTAVEAATQGKVSVSTENAQESDLEREAREHEENAIAGMSEEAKAAANDILDLVESDDTVELPISQADSSFDFGYNVEGYDESGNETEDHADTAGSATKSEGESDSARQAGTEPEAAERTDDAGGWSQGVAVAGDRAVPTIGGVQKQGGRRASTSDLMDGFTPEPAGLFDVPKTDAPATAKLEDFGEKIGGARKDFSAKMQHAKTLDVATAPFAKTWPEPDYNKLIAQGFDKDHVSLVRALRDEIPDKPRQKWKLKQWVALVESLRDHAEKALQGNSPVIYKTLEGLKDTNSAVANIRGRVELYNAVGHELSLRGVTLKRNHWAFFQGEKDVTKWQVEREQKASVFGNMPQELGIGDTKEEAIADFKSKLADYQPSDPQGKKPAEFVVYSKRGEPGYFIGKKVGKDYIDLQTFPGVVEARTYLKENRPDLERQLAQLKDAPYERRSSNSPRIGENVRDGKDATPEMFQGAYGFRGVEFGNYVNAAERQGRLNEAFDALHDLAGIIGVPTKALSLNGELGLAFGARGHGGSRAAAAHYEPDKVVINLTKNNGAGSLAHEWFHAIDSYFSRQRGKGRDYITDHTVKYGAQDATRQELIDAFKKVNAALNDTNLRARSRNLDRTRTKDYWSTGIEMHARAFENYVIDKLDQQSKPNDFLANVKGASEYADDMLAGFANGQDSESLYPYLLPGEVEKVRGAFDDLFSTMKSRDTEKGTALYSIDNGGSASTLTPEAITRVKALISRALPGESVDFNVVPSIEYDGPGMAGAYAQHGVTSGKIQGLQVSKRDITTDEVRSVITLAVDGATDRTGYHEVLHAAEALGVISPKDIGIMERIYPDKDGVKSGERRADAFADYVENGTKPQGYARMLFDRIKAFLKRLKQYAMGRGWRTAEDVFGDVESGKAKGRAEAQSEGLQASATGPRSPFYSKLEEVVNNKMGGKMHVLQLNRMLENNGVTRDEIDTVMGEFAGKESVSKAEVQEAIKANSVPLKDVVLGESGKQDELYKSAIEAAKRQDNFGYDYPSQFLSDAANEDDWQHSWESDNEGDTVAIQKYIDAVKNDKPTHFSQYTEPGAVDGSYREMFVTAPPSESGGISPEVQAKYAGEMAYNKRHLEVMEELGNPSDIRGAKNLIEATDARMVAESKLPVWQDGHSQYSDIQNPIVRIRFDEREVDGKRVLFVEEMQGPSDANQQKMPDYLRKRIYDLGVKGVLAYAKENGFNGVSWTTGAMQAARYDLSKQIDSVDVIHNNYPGAEGTYDVNAEKNGQMVANEKEISRERLADFIGKDLAAKAVAETLPGLSSTYSGLDLKVGGEGLTTLYDRTLPSLFKKYGKEGLSEVTIKGKEARPVIKGGFKTREEAELYLDAQGDEDFVIRMNRQTGSYDVIDKTAINQRPTVPFIPITDKTPASYPQFALARNTGEPKPKGFIKEDVLPAMETAGRTLTGSWDSIKRTFTAASRGPLAEQTALDLRELGSIKARNLDQVATLIEPAREYFDKFGGDMTDTGSRSFQFIKAVELGNFIGLPEVEKPFARLNYVIFDNLLKRIQDRNGLRASTTSASKLAAQDEGRDFETFYFPRLWKDEKKGMEVYMRLASKRPFEGRKAFMKKRSIELYEDGIKAGLVPAYDNPMDMIYHKAGEMEQWVMAKDFLAAEQKAGRVIEVPAGHKAPEGMTQLDDRMGTIYAGNSVPVWKMLRELAKSAKKDLFFEDFGKKVFPSALEIAAGADDTMKQEANALRWDPAEDQINIHGMHRGTGRSYSDLIVEKMLENPEKFQQEAPALYAELDRIAADRPKIQEIMDTPAFENLQQKLPVGGQIIKAHLYAPEESANVFNNLVSKGLRGNDAFRAYMGASNVLNQFQLGLSLFHAGFTSMDAAVSSSALGVMQASHGDIYKAIKSFAESPIAPVTNAIRGHQMMKEWDMPGSVNEVIANLVQAAQAGGARAKMDKFYHTEISKKMMQAFRGGNVLGGVVRAPFALMEKASKPILEWLVPRQKMGIIAAALKYEMERNPKMTHQELQRTAAEIVDSVDNRMGQLIYDNLFWNKITKDLAMASVRSVGWNLGTIRELGGGILDAVGEGAKLATGKQARVTPRMAYVIALPLMVGLMGALIQYLATGIAPGDPDESIPGDIGTWLEDIYNPRIGGIDRNGKPRRVLLPSYMKDVYHYYKAPFTTIANKLHPMLAIIGEMLRNKNFYGVEVRHPGDPLVKQAMELAAHVGKSFEPFASRGIRKNVQEGANPLETVLPFIGITPAPSDINKTKAEKLAEEMIRERIPQGARTQEQYEKSQQKKEITRLLKTGQRDEAAEKIAELRASGILNQRDIYDIRDKARHPYLYNMVKHMDDEGANRVYEVATPEEQDQIKALVKRKDASFRKNNPIKSRLNRESSQGAEQ